LTLQPLIDFSGVLFERDRFRQGGHAARSGRFSGMAQFRAGSCVLLMDNPKAAAGEVLLDRV
jgi:hypothetical protein